MFAGSARCDRKSGKSAGTAHRQGSTLASNGVCAAAPGKNVEEGKRRMAGTTGLEPATSDVTGRRSNQLNYVPEMENVGNFRLPRPRPSLNSENCPTRDEPEEWV